MENNGNDRILSVSELTNYIKNLFDQEPFLAHIIVEGEISNYVHNSSGHLYFTLKDEMTQISCVMWKSQAMLLPIEPKDGDKVYVKGSVEVYPKSGRYQIYCEALKEQGLGDLFQKYEALKKKLEAKGYFRPERKRPLPPFPKGIAILTSKTGAVIEDLKSIILKRSQFSNLIIYPTKVQGDDAKESIIANIDKANSNPSVDVIILARGGGSIEDLWPFNEEEVADAIYHSIKPIISAIGHETDFTIADFTADLRAATPSDAALIVVKDNKDLRNSLDSLSLRLNMDFENSLSILKKIVDKLMSSPVFKMPERLFNEKKQTIMNLSDKLSLLSPSKIFIRELDNVNNLKKHLDAAYQTKLLDSNRIYEVLKEKINLLNPLAVLDKGYSVTYHENKVVKSSKDVEIGDEISSIVKDGTIISVVKARK